MANKPDKGKAGGSCNRTACQAPNAIYRHTANFNAHYCYDCALMIARGNAAHYGTVFTFEPCSFKVSPYE